VSLAIPLGRRGVEGLTIFTLSRAEKNADA